MQLDLFAAPVLPEPVESGLLCSFGSPTDNPEWDGPHHCAGCAAEVERMCQEFAADVAAGKFNARGYTKAEWRAAGYPVEGFMEAVA